ncbi:MAG: T9SS type A sorting domain-containing protein [Bacteroidia bacterium]|nr:T9SS type A sorting domain-containing protein [Bacteroidia bacterium]
MIPQVTNPLGNIITDTLNWTLISGTFTANGDEKYLVIGNFLSDAATTKSIMIPTSTESWSEYFIDDVSCIPLDLPAFAGKDTSCIPGTTVYIGRTRDVGIDEACTWYQLPNLSVPIATAVAGLTVSPAITATYVVRQEICGNVKWDTVVVFKDGVGLEKFKVERQKIKVYPVPANGVLQLEIQEARDNSQDYIAVIINSLGQAIREEKLQFNNQKAELRTGDLANGVYYLSLENRDKERRHQRFVISR